MLKNTREEKRHVDYDKVDEINETNFHEFVEAASHPDARQHAVANIVQFVRDNRIPEDHEDELFNIARGALDGKRSLSERKDLVVLGTLLVLGTSSDGFASHFAESIAKQVPDILLLEEDGEELARAMFDAIIICEALENHQVTVAPNTLLSDWLATFKLPKDPAVAMAFLRCLAVIAQSEKSSAVVTEMLRNELHRSADDVRHAIGVVNAVMIAFENLEDKSHLPYAMIAPLENFTGKEVGGRDARKELNTLLRRAEDLMVHGKGPNIELSFVLPHTRGDKLDLNIDDYNTLALLDAIRSAAGDKYYMLIRDSDVLRAYSGLEEVNEDRLTRNANRNEKDREERYDRLVGAKERAKERSRARDRKQSH